MRQILSIIILALHSLVLSGQIVDGGNGHALILDKQGNVWTIGRNNYGQLGDSTLENSATPKKVKYLNNIIAISRGYDHSVALKKDGTAWCWGHNYFAELGNGTREHSSWPVEVLQISDSEISVLTDVISIASVGYHTLALKKDGTVWGWGGNTFNELGKKGNEFQQYAVKIEGLPKIKEVAVGWHHSVVLDYNGGIWVCGSDPAFQFNEETRKYYDHPILLKNLPKFTKIACGSWHSLAIDENRNVWAWGKNHFGMLGTGDTTSHSTPVLIKSLKNIVDIGGGCFQSIAVDSTGKIFTFGDNPSGQLGTGNFSRCYSPKLMPLDINGILLNDTLEESKTKISSKPPKENLSPYEALFNWDITFKIVKYSLFLISIIFNIILYRKLKSYR